MLCLFTAVSAGCRNSAGNDDGKPGKTYAFDDGITEDSDETHTEIPEPEHHTYTQDFETVIKSNDADWTVNSEGEFKNGIFRSANNHTYLALKHKVKADTLNIEVDMKVARSGNVNNVSGYIGLRLPEHGNQFAAVGANGVWLAFHGKQVGIIDTWPNVKMFSNSVDFSKTQRLLITDDVKNNVITVDVLDGEERKNVMVITITDNKEIRVINEKGKDKIKAKFGHDIDSKGFVAFWASGGNSGECVMDNIKMDWTDVVQEQYVPADKLAIRDLYADTWVASDDLGRTVTDGAAAPRDKLIGLFYQIWFTPTSVTYSDQKNYDHYRIYREGGFEAVKKAYSQGPIGWGHYWAEPYFGFYLTNDRWIIRKHASMLSDLGIDFIYLDVTNGNPKTTSYKAIMKEYEMMRQEGLDTPDICFMLADETSLVDNVFMDLWDNIYSTGQYSDLYVMYDGKPLILGNFNKSSEEIKQLLEGFSWRRCWALHENLKGGENFWSWMCQTPQVASYNTNKDNAVEEISISAGILANTSTGRSFSNGRQPKVGTLPDGTKDYFQFNLETTGQGLLFAEQMQRAVEVDPYVVLITEWNEWAAGRWPGNGNPTIANTYISWTSDYYVDCFNPEFSRDIEPMKDGFKDNYYYQLAAFLRSFRGSRPAAAASGQHSITLDGGLGQWADVWPEYRDTTGDTIHRDSLGNGGLVTYKNSTGRNDIVSAKVSRADGKTYFLAVCADNLTAREGNNWMNLFIDSDGNSGNGWYGYDLIINRENGSVEKFTGGWNMQKLGQCEVFTGDNYLVIAVDDAACGLGAEFCFKWADNSTTEGDIMQFLDLGDAAPNARFNYAYRTGSKDVALTESTKAAVGDGASFTAGRYYALSEGKAQPVYPEDTSVAPVMYKNRVFVPAASLGIVKGLSASVDGNKAEITYKGKVMTFEDGNADVKYGKDTYQIPVEPFVKDGVLYVALNAVAHIAGLNYAQNELGIAIITSSSIKENESVFAELYRAY